MFRIYPILKTRKLFRHRIIVSLAKKMEHSFWNFPLQCILFKVLILLFNPKTFLVFIQYICTEAPWISLHLTKEFAIFPANSTKIEHLKVKKHCWLTIFMKFVGTIGWQPPTLMGVKVAPYEQMDQETQKLPYLSGFESVFCQRCHTQYFLYYMVKILYAPNCLDF